MSGWLRLFPLLCLVACVETKPVRAPTQANKPHSAAADTFLSTPPLPQYRLAWQFPERSAPQQAVLAGVRVEQKPSGLAVADTIAYGLLDGGRAVPSFAGGGFVFWGPRGVYRAKRFLGRLEPLTATPFAVRDVAFGPGFWLARSRDGERLAFNPTTGAERPLMPTGMVDIAATGDGRVVAVLELGRAVVSTDGGVTYREVQSELGGDVTALSQEPLGFVVGPKSLVTLGGSGKLGRRVLPKDIETAGYIRERRNGLGKYPDANERERWAPLNQAISHGVVRTPGRALVAFGASVAEVDLSTGKLLSQGPQLLPDAPDCDLHLFGNELLMACRTQSALAVLSHLEAEHPSIERRFNGRPALRVGLGQLLVEAPCDGEPLPLSVCVRRASGEWKPLTLRADPPSLRGVGGATTSGGAGGAGGTTAATPPPTVQAYAPRADGGAIAFSNELKGYIDLATGRVVKPGGDFAEVLRDPAQCLVDASGTLRCLVSTGPVAFDADGKPEPRVFRFSFVEGAGLRGLGQDKLGHLFQTQDLGKTWVEVQAPPVRVEPPLTQNHCSDAGCAFNGWLRTGWDATPSTPADLPELVDVPARVEPRLPTLACRIERAGLPQLTGPLNAGVGDDADGSKRFVPGFGASQLREDHYQSPLELPTLADAGSSGQHGMVSTFAKQLHDAKNPDAELYQLEPLRFHFVDYFDPTARINAASVDFRELSRVAQRIGAPAPGTDFESWGSIPIAPVLGPVPGHSAGFVAAPATVRLWVNGSRVTVITPWDDSVSLGSAALERDGSLLLLTSDEPGRVWRFRQGAGVELFGVPSTPLRPSHASADALGISETGDNVVLRFPSGAKPPTKDDPALVYAPGKPIEELAPWSTLRLALDPACTDKAGYRAIVVTPASWLKAVQGGTDVTTDRGMIAAVRWSKARVCLEAVEVAAEDFWHADEAGETRLVLTTAPKLTAARVGVGPGFELREPISCTLTSPP